MEKDMNEHSGSRICSTSFAGAIDASQADWQREHGKCSMCDCGGRPDEAGYHRYNGETYRCGNVEACGACHGCLPPGEICMGCFRMNPYEYQC